MGQRDLLTGRVPEAAAGGVEVVAGELDHLLSRFRFKSSCTSFGDAGEQTGLVGGVEDVGARIRSVPGFDNEDAPDCGPHLLDDGR